MDAKAAERRWYHPTPAWLVYGAVLATGLLYASERWRWFPVGYQKGFPVLLAVAVVTAVLILILAWMLAGLVFRRRVQIGLRTMFVFVTLSAVVCSWLAVRIKQARRQEEAVAAIPGSLWYDWELLDRRPPPGSEPLRDLLGIDFFADVQVVFADDARASDEDLANFALLTELKRLRFDATNVTQEGLMQLAALSNLQKLWLVDAKVTDGGVKKFRRELPNCQIYLCTAVVYDTAPIYAVRRKENRGKEDKEKRKGGTLITTH